MKKAREEWVRQRLKELMVQELGYPAHELVQEIALSNLIDVKDTRKPPLRRLDLVCVSKNAHQKGLLAPLLIIECKAHKLNQTAFNQLCGYNAWVKAPFVALSNFHQTIMGAYNSDEKRYKLVNRFLPYAELKEALTRSGL